MQEQRRLGRRGKRASGECVGEPARVISACEDEGVTGLGRREAAAEQLADNLAAGGEAVGARDPLDRQAGGLGGACAACAPPMTDTRVPAPVCSSRYFCVAAGMVSGVTSSTGTRLAAA